ncbi:hypothetical protein, partial [Mesorhizobium sp.]|uniref:hypothetical protein n=1 Tax=Mesorhizobium sp. TaxID=1871066 RepID=UPI00121708DB
MSLSLGSPMQRVARLFCVLALFELVSLWPSRAEEPSDYSGEVPASLRGPFIFEPDVVVALDCAQHSACDGPLNFRTLIEAKARKYEELGQKNPFLLG